jgi:hypothetical protein
MSLSLQDPILAKRRLFHAPVVSEQASLWQLSMAFFSWLMQQGGRPDMQVVEHDALSSTDVVIADAACNLLAWLMTKATATATFSKATDNATTGSDAASDLRVWLSGVDNVVGLFYPKGQPFANGITLQGTTTADGGTGSGDDGATGVVLLKAA